MSERKNRVGCSGTKQLFYSVRVKSNLVSIKPTQTSATILELCEGLFISRGDESMTLRFLYSVDSV